MLIDSESIISPRGGDIMMAKRSSTRAPARTGTRGRPDDEKEILMLPSFQAALQSNPAAASELPLQTFWRYANGDLPAIVHWLLKHPALLVALAVDAQMRQGTE